MKSINEYINNNDYVNITEAGNNQGMDWATNMADYLSDKKHDIYGALANAYIENVFTKEQLAQFVQAGIDKTNSILKIFGDNDISEFVNGQMLGRIIEKNLAESFPHDEDGFKYKQGSEGDSDKDINCESAPKNVIDAIKKYISDNPDIPEENHIKNISANFFGIELKCSQGSDIVGNKSYAIDGDGKKEKSSFYLLINYGLNTEVPETPTDKENEPVKSRLVIKNYSVYFGYITSDCWWYGQKGNAASLKLSKLKETNRLIEIKSK